MVQIPVQFLGVFFFSLSLSLETFKVLFALCEKRKEHKNVRVDIPMF